ncbi:MAG: cyclic nucleotide-binding domain-containing protein [Anaerolineales bacterium]|nr:cyclic nucleotide-binding domain-containing protein [Anaerolineales bacterium]
MSSYASILKQADIFYKLNPAQLEMISSLCEEKSFQANEIIFLEGTSSDDLYIIIQGEVDIQVNPALVSDSLEDEYQPITIATFRRGQSFGEIALVDKGVRSATARARVDQTRLLIIPSQKLNSLCDTDPLLGYRLMKNLAADLSLKIRSTDLRIREELLYSSKK